MFLTATIRGLSVASVLVATWSCSSVGPLEEAARDANHQIAELETQIQTKIKTENEYYTATVNHIREDFQRARSDDLTIYITRTARKFVRAQKKTLTAESVDPMLQKYLEESVKSWKTLESDRQGAMAKLTAKLDEGRATLEREEAKIKSLRSKLRALGSAKGTEDLVRFLVGYSREVSSQVKELRDEEGGS